MSLQYKLNYDFYVDLDSDLATRCRSTFLFGL